MSFINIILTLTLLISLALAGNVKFIDFQTDYSNIDLARKFFFTFQLDNNFPNTGYMKIELPFDQSNPLTAEYYEADPQTCNSATFPIPKKTASINIPVGPTNIYWINYPETLSNKKVYTLILTLQSAIDNTIFSNAAIKFRPVSIGTYASIDTVNPHNLLSYDFNPVFTMINFESSVAKSLVASVISGNSGSLKSSNTLIVRFTPSKQQIRRVVISFPQAQGIQFDSASDPPNFCLIATLILNQDFTCQQTNKNDVLLIFVSDLTSSQYDVSLKINFPNFYDTSDIQVIGLRSGDNVVVEWNQIVNGVFTTIPTWSSRQIFGYQQQLLSSNVCVYRGSSATDETYNSLKFVFRVSADMLAGENYRLTMDLGSEAFILTNSIVATNFVNFSALLTIKCTAVNNNNMVQCDNISSLKAGTTYSISLRVSLQYNTVTETSFTTGFGKLGIYPLMADGTYYSLPSVSNESATNLNNLVASVCLKNNNNWLNQINAANKYDYQIVHTRTNTDLTKKIDEIPDFSIKQGNSQIIQFYLEFVAADFSGIVSSKSELYVQANYKIIVPAGAPGTTSSASTCLTPITMQRTIAIPAASDPYQILTYKFFYTTDADSNGFIDVTGVVISLGQHDIKFKSSVNPSDTLNNDFIFTIIPDNTNPTINVKTTLVNSFVIPSTLYSDINISLVNFWTGTAEGNDANLLPTFIRVNVFFSTNAPTIPTGNWIIFFDNLDFLEDPTDSTKPSCSITQTSTSCGKQNGSSNSYHYLFQNYLTFTSTLSTGMTTIDQSFTIIVPVKTIVNEKIVRVRTALLDTNGDLIGISKQFQFQFKAVGISQEASIQDYNVKQNIDFEGLNLLFNVGDKKVGQLVDTATVNIVAADVKKILSPNTSANQGAGITFTSLHNIVQDPSFDVQDGGFGLISSKPQERCIKFGYIYQKTLLSTKSGRYGFYCPLKANVGQSTTKSFLNVLKLSLPWQAGTSIPNIYGAFSNNIVIQDTGFDINGLLLKFTADNTLNAMLSNELTSVQTDIDLPISQRFVKLQVTFTTTNILPANFNFVLTTSQGASQPFLFTVNELVQCSLYQKTVSGDFKLINYPCTQIYREFQVIIQLSGTAELPSGTYKIRIGGINVVDNPLMKQDAYFETQTIEGKTIDKTPNSIPIYYNFSPNQMSFTISDQSFFIPNKYAMSVFQFTFNVKGREIYQDEYVLFNLDAFSVDNLDINIPICKILSPSDKSISLLWKECYFNGDLKQLKLTPLNDITILNANNILENTFIVQLYNIRVPRTPVEEYFISGGIYNTKDNSQPIIFQENISLPDRQDEMTISKITQLVLQSKSFNTIGSLSQFQFSIKPSKQDLDFNSMIMIYLPSYYPALPDYAEPVCFIQLIDVNTVQPRVFTRCEYLQDRIIVVRDIFPTLLKNFAYSLTVGGIPQPSFSVAQNIFIALIQKYDQVSTTVLEYLEVTDILPTNPSASIIRVSDFSKTKTTWIEQDSYIFTLQPSSNVAVKSYLIIDFPSDWVDKNQNKPAINCYLQLAGQADAPLSCVQEGYRIIGEVTGGLVANSIYTLKLNGFSNPHNSLCIGQGVVVQISDPAQTTISQRSYLTIMNVGNLVFDRGMTSNYIFKWELINNDNVQDGETTLSSVPSILTVYRGTYSRKLRLSIANGNRLSTDLSIKLKQTLSGQTPFQTYPAVINLYVGDYYVDLRIGALRTVTPGIYSIYFELVNGGSYNIPPLLKVQILNDPYTIPDPSINDIVVPISGYGLPIYWNMDAAVPIDTFKIETDIEIIPDLVLDYKAYSDMNFKTERESDFIQLKSDAEPITDKRTSQVKMYIDQKDTSYYQFKSKVVGITLVNGNKSTPVLSASVKSVQSTSITFNLNSNQLVLVYYQIQLKSSKLAFDFKTLREKVRVLTKYKFDDVNQVQYGMIPIYQINTNVELTIPNLFSSREYVVQFFPLSQMEIQGQIKTFNSIPKSNLDQLIKTRLFTKSILTSKHMTYLACQHSKIFLYPYQRVRSIYEDYCDPKVTAASLPKAEISQTQQVYYFYLYPFEYIEVVEQPGTVYDSAKLKNNQVAAYKTMFTNIFTALGLSVLDDYQYGGKVDIYPPEFTSSGKTTATKNSLTVTDITLKNNGIIFAVLEQLEISVKGRVQYVVDPTFEQVRAGKNSTGLVALDKAHAVYEGTPLTFQFDNLTPATHYRVVMYATSEDPSPYKLITVNVTSVEKTLPANSNILTSYTVLFTLIFFSLFN